MTAYPSANPFPPAIGFDVIAGGGTPPYTCTARPSPPNPPGVTVDGNHVEVPPDTPSGVTVWILVKDSSDPPQSVPCQSQTS
jgi:hypothetical protein